MILERLTKDSFLWKSQTNGTLFLSTCAGLETTIYAYYLASFEGAKLVEFGVSGNA